MFRIELIKAAAISDTLRKADNQDAASKSPSLTYCLNESGHGCNTKNLVKYSEAGNQILKQSHKTKSNPHNFFAIKKQQ